MKPHSDSSPPRLGSKPVVLSFAEAKSLLLAELQDSTKDRKSTLRQLAYIHSEARHYDQAQAYLRELIALQPDLESKASSVLAMGATAEMQQDFEGAVTFYREALAMEPERNEVWYLIHNNLGFSLNMLGQFAEGEKFCRAAVEINGARPNAYKNLGISLTGQGRFAEAAQSYVTGAAVTPRDHRSLNLLKQLLQQHPDLEHEFRPGLAHCEEALKFGQAAFQRGSNDKSFKILVACNHPDLEEMIIHLFCGITMQAVHLKLASAWDDFIPLGCSGGFDLALVIPNNLRRDETEMQPTESWAFAVTAVKQIKGNSETAIMVGGDPGELADYGHDCKAAGADAIIELPFNFAEFADAARHALTRD